MGSGSLVVRIMMHFAIEFLASRRDTLVFLLLCHRAVGLPLEEVLAQPVSTVGCVLSASVVEDDVRAQMGCGKVCPLAKVRRLFTLSLSY